MTQSGSGKSNSLPVQLPAMICASCGAKSAAEMSFCGHCGARLERRRQVAERRQLTVLFCDLVGSSALAEALDPEEYSHLLTSFQKTVTETVVGHGGHVAQLLGDGILVYFGYPVSHENSPDLAVAAAVAVIRGLERSGQAGAGGPEAAREPLRVRIGIHTGPVVIDPRSDVKERRNLALGSTPNVAARLQQKAEPGAILVSEDTRRLLHTNPVLKDLGAHELKGLSELVRIYEVLAGDREQEIPSGVRPFSPSPMVNRESEIAALASRWEAAKSGSGCSLLIEGEAGVGKSRLVSHFASSVGADAEVLAAGCSPLRAESALFPVHQLLRATLDLDPTAPEETQLEALRSALARTDPEENAVPILAAFLRLPVEDGSLEGISPELLRRKTHAALRRWVFSRARNLPAMLIFEDLHWSDPSTLEWLGDLFREVDGYPLFVLMTGRLGTHESVGGGASERLRLSGLEERHAEQLIRGVAGGAVSESWLERLWEQTDGVPLYLEELTRGVLEATAERPAEPDDWPALEIPGSLRDLLTARLDRLGAAKGLAQWAAVLGRTFLLASLRRMAQDEAAEEADDFERHLAALVHAGILETETRSDVRYRFRHALIQEAAYRSLLRAERRERHRAVAEILAAGGPMITAGPGEVAHHFAEAGLGGQAAEWWLKAGKGALARSENQESIAFLRRGVGALASLDSTDSEPLLLDLEGTLATALTAVHGYAAAGVERLHDSVGERSKRLGDSREIFVGLRNTLPFYLVRAQHAKARAIGEELVEMARRLDDASLLLEARLALATACFWLGDAEQSRRNAIQGLEIYRSEAHAAHAVEFGQDPGILCHLYAAWSQWWLGAFAAARRHLEQALELARAVKHPHSLAMALDHACSLRLYFQEWRQARDLVEEQLEISARYGFSMWAAMAGFRSAWLDCLAGEMDSGIDRMEAGLEAFRATGAEIARPLHLSYLAHAHLLGGHGDAGLAVVEEALAAAEETSENHYLAELHRLQGELAVLADGGLSARGKESFLSAIDVARRQGALALELRAALSWHRVANADSRASAAEGLRRVAEALKDAGEAPDLTAARAALARG